MADIDFTAQYLGSRDVITWATLTSTNAAGTEYEPERFRAAFATVQVFGTFDSATLVMQGSNNGTNWETLKDTLGSSISFTAAGYAEISTGFSYIRPSTSGGGGSQDLDCILTARG